MPEWLQIIVALVALSGSMIGEAWLVMRFLYPNKEDK